MLRRFCSAARRVSAAFCSASRRWLRANTACPAQSAQFPPQISSLSLWVSLLVALGVYLPLITTNCAVLGVALTNVQNGNGFWMSVLTGFGTAVGFAVAIVIMAGLREKMAHNAVPKAFQGMPIVLLTAGLMAIAFYGFSGLQF